MRQKLGMAAFVLLLVAVWGVGFLWVRGDLKPGSDKPDAKSSAHPSRAPVPSSTPSAVPEASGKYSGTVTKAEERQPVAVNPVDARPKPIALPPVAKFTMATFNLLGNSHTQKGSDSPRYASGPQRMNGAVQILAQHQVSVVGFQEFQPPQRVAFQRDAKGWAMYPGLSMGRRAGENSVAWRTDTWEEVQAKVIPIPYFNGRIRPMPYLLLRNKQTGVQAWFSTFHNPADVRQFQHQQRYRSAGTTREVQMVNELIKTKIPVFVTGDMNERADYFCRMTSESPMIAAAGGSNDSGHCVPPPKTQIDWIFGSPGVEFSGYTIDRSSLVRRTTDHPVVTTEVTLDALNWANAFVPDASSTTP